MFSISVILKTSLRFSRLYDKMQGKRNGRFSAPRFSGLGSFCLLCGGAYFICLAESRLQCTWCIQSLLLPCARWPWANRSALRLLLLSCSVPSFLPPARSYSVRFPRPCDYIILYLRRYINGQSSQTYLRRYVDFVYLHRYIYCDMMYQ